MDWVAERVAKTERAIASKRRELARSTEDTPVGKITRLNDQILALKSQLERKDFWKPPSDRKPILLFDPKDYMPVPHWMRPEKMTDKGYKKRRGKVAVLPNLRTTRVSDHGTEEGKSYQSRPAAKARRNKRNSGSVVLQSTS